MSTRDTVLASLRAAGEAGVSGEAIASALGVSRVAVSKHVAALRALGYGIESRAGAGYRLTSTPDLALPEEVSPLLVSPLWSEISGGLVTASTNDDARALALGGAAEGTVVVAARQSAGRGRLGRDWSSPEGGAYFSMVLRPGVAPAEAGPLALVIGLGVARGLESLGVRVGLKWPNDVNHESGKLAGILLEMSAEADRVEWIVAGVGLNVHRRPGADERAAFVADAVPDITVARAAAAALDGIAAAYLEWLAGGFAALRDEYEARSVLTGTTVTVSDAAGRVRAEGVVAGVDDGGRLLVETDGRIEAVSSGEVTLRR